MSFDMKKFEERMNSEEGKVIIKGFVDEINRRQKMAKALVSNDEYIKWLEEFTKKHPTFNDHDWLYYPEQISKEDNHKVDMLCKFYRGIDYYANDNYIYPTPCDFGGYYSIKYNGKVYEIGLLIGQGALTFCNTDNINKEAAIIDFEDIAKPSEVTLLRTQTIEKELSRIDVLFRNLFEKKIPAEAIINRTDLVLRKLQKDKK